jgi:hypothetical protein
VLASFIAAAASGTSYEAQSYHQLPKSPSIIPNFLGVAPPAMVDVSMDYPIVHVAQSFTRGPSSLGAGPVICSWAGSQDKPVCPAVSRNSGDALVEHASFLAAGILVFMQRTLGLKTLKDSLTVDVKC